jgi:hypothetical protein
MVKSAAIRWLRENNRKWEAVFLTKELSKLPDLPMGTVRDILIWCQGFSDDPDALWRVSRLSNAMMRLDILEQLDILGLFVEVVDILVRRQFTSEHLQDPRISLMATALCSSLARIELYLHLDLNRRVGQLLVDLVRHPASFIAIDHHSVNAERPAIVHRIGRLLRRGRLSAGSDRDALRRFLGWVDRWHPVQKLQVDFVIDELKREFPDLDVGE